MSTKCRICGGVEGGQPIELREVMFGSGEPFRYFRCADCGCLQISEAPADVAQYYPANYYSYGGGSNGLLGALKARVRTGLAIDGPAALFSGRAWWEKGDLKSVRDAGVSRSARILDIGCGSGHLIASLKDIGFNNVLGADPFIAEEVIHANGARVVKQQASDLNGPFDLIMMHHSLEHVWDQAEAAGNLYRLLAPNGKCIVRIPTVDCWAWEEYGRDWVQLDAPRHFYLHSRASIALLLETAGLTVTKIVDDSFDFQILGSEKIRRGLPLIDAADGANNYARHLPKEVIAGAAEKARRLNHDHRGDAIAVHAIRAGG